MEQRRDGFASPTAMSERSPVMEWLMVLAIFGGGFCFRL